MSPPKVFVAATTADLKSARCLQTQPLLHPQVIPSRLTSLRFAGALLVLLSGIGCGRMPGGIDQDNLAEQMSQVQEAYRVIQGNVRSLSDWPQDRLEKELANQIQMNVDDLRALLTAGNSSLDPLVAGQALLACGKRKEAGQKFAAVIQQDAASSPQRLKQAYEGKAQIACDKAKYDEALHYSKKAADSLDKVSDPLGWAHAQGEVNFLQLQLARYREAEPLMREVVRLREQHLPPNHPDIAAGLNNLAQLLQDTNRLGEAEPLMRRLVTILENKGGEPLPNYPIALNNLAALLTKTNRLSGAEPLMQQALKIDEASFGTDHPNVATDLSNLASLLADNNRLTEAEPLMRRALKIGEASFGPDHPKVAIKLNKLGALLQITNRFTEAEPLVRRALKIDEASFGLNHPDVATDLNNLAQLLQATNRLAEAEPLMQRAVKIFETSYGKDHPNVATALLNLALLVKATNRLSEAEPLSRRAVGILVTSQRSTGHEHPNFRDYVENYNRILTDLKLPEDQIQAKLKSVGVE